MPKIVSKAIREKRLALIKRAQELYASGDYSIREISRLLDMSVGWVNIQTRAIKSKGVHK